jgi:transposase InsO family protein/transposase
MARADRQVRRALALWRHEQIEEALGETQRARRAAIVAHLARTPVSWPSGDVRPVSAATAYRWIGAYARGGLPALAPARRKDRGTRRARLPDAVVKKAVALLVDDPDLTLTLLLALLAADPELATETSTLRISRSTLARRLAADPLYAQLRRAAQRKRRRRFVARHPHDIWHLDAKGPVTVTLVSRQKLVFHILTILDDASRAVLAALIALTPDLAAAVRVFRRAASRWGLPARLYADRASIFDAKAFRAGLALLGCHRIRTKAKNPEAHGKIEAYHRVLVLWFTKRLLRQKVVDLAHLQQLLDGLLERVYQEHHHRGLGQSPRAALADRVSARTVSAQRLFEAFRQERWLRAHPKTGEVDLQGTTYLVPEALVGQRLCFRLDPDPQVPPVVVHPQTEEDLPLRRAAVRPGDAATPPPDEPRWGQGHLQALYDDWQGQVRPQAEAGFGLPEVLALCAEATGRHVPASDAEAARVARVYRALGPLPEKATRAAFANIVRTLGHGRPLATYLDALARRVAPPSIPTKPRRNR